MMFYCVHCRMEYTEAGSHDDHAPGWRPITSDFYEDVMNAGRRQAEAQEFRDSRPSKNRRLLTSADNEAEARWLAEAAANAVQHFPDFAEKYLANAGRHLAIARILKGLEDLHS